MGSIGHFGFFVAAGFAVAESAFAASKRELGVVAAGVGGVSTGCFWLVFVMLSTGFSAGFSALAHSGAVLGVWHMRRSGQRAERAQWPVPS